ncbi:dynamin family protein [Peribacillus acanthi]|uniref:dynamin family protein n=1 Tax=Peribacillus acanthi TaxID=2171554 RepID=UPI000D3EA9BE|nr:dynamin family protein [Peribacillus acanthi]
MPNILELQKRLYNLQQFLHATLPLSNTLKSLNTWIDDSSEKNMVMIMGEFKAGKSTFINALLGEELLVTDVTPATAINTIITYGDRYYYQAVFKNGNKEWIDQEQLKAISSEGDLFGAHLRKKMDYLILQAPIDLLKDITFIDSPGLNSPFEEHTVETLRFMKRADDIIWLFRYGLVGRSTEASAIDHAITEGITPLGIVNAIDLHFEQSDEDIDEYLQEEWRKHQHRLRDLIGISAQDALEAKLENDEEKWEWSNFDQLQRHLQNIANDVTKKNNRMLKRCLAMFEELQIEILSVLEKEHYDTHTQVLTTMIHSRQKELTGKKEEIVNHLETMKQEANQLDLFSKKVSTLSEFQSILKQSPLKRHDTHLTEQIDGLFSKITTYETKVKDFREYYLSVKDDHVEVVGRGPFRVKQLFASKKNLSKIDRSLSRLEQKHEYCFDLVQDIKHQQETLTTYLEKSLVKIQNDLINRRKNLWRQANQKKEQFYELLEKEHHEHQPSLLIIEKYQCIDELQRWIAKDLLPVFENWKKVDNAPLQILGQIQTRLSEILQIKTSSHLLNIYHSNRDSLKKDDMEIGFRWDLPYNVQDQVPLYICQEYQPMMVDFPSLNTTYLRPYTMSVLTSLLLFYLYQSNGYRKLWNLKSQAVEVVGSIWDEKVAIELEDTEETPVSLGQVEVIVDSLNIRSEPNLESEKVGVASYGDTFEVLEEQAHWIRIGEGQWISGKPQYTRFVTEEVRESSMVESEEAEGSFENSQTIFYEWKGSYYGQLSGNHVGTELMITNQTEQYFDFVLTYFDNYWVDDENGGSYSGYEEKTKEGRASIHNDLATYSDDSCTFNFQQVDGGILFTKSDCSSDTDYWEDDFYIKYP